jgi:hypothetical protein
MGSFMECAIRNRQGGSVHHHINVLKLNRLPRYDTCVAETLLQATQITAK